MAQLMGVQQRFDISIGTIAIGIGVAGAAGGAILGGVAYAAICWW
ncbi:TPA: hypothetical protein ACLXQZ_002127 [Streptococcus pneumoniae]